MSDLPVAAPDHADHAQMIRDALAPREPGEHHPGCDSRIDKECDCYGLLSNLAYAALDALLVERQQAEERIEQLTEALGEAEWHGSAWVGMECCPVCSGERREGHEPGCLVGVALAGEGDTTHVEEDAE